MISGPGDDLQNKNGMGNRMSTKPALVIGTRGSPLALAQAYETRDRLIAAHGFNTNEISIEIIKTQGDAIQDKALRAFGGKGLFTKEIEDRLLEGSIDLAVHSMKDVQTQLPVGLQIAAILPREDVRDAFVSPVSGSIEQLERGARVGTSSLRRQAQLKHIRPDLEVVTFRGSVQTRLEKLARGEVMATFLAVAGLKRLGMDDVITSILEPPQMLPAVAQGAIGIECREDDHKVGSLLEPLNDLPSALRLRAERAFLKRLDGSCRTPIAGLAEIEGEKLKLSGQILAPDGSLAFDDVVTGRSDEAAGLGQQLAEMLIERAGQDFMAMMDC